MVDAELGTRKPRDIDFHGGSMNARITEATIEGITRWA